MKVHDTVGGGCEVTRPSHVKPRNEDVIGRVYPVFRHYQHGKKHEKETVWKVEVIGCGDIQQFATAQEAKDWMMKELKGDKS